MALQVSERGVEFIKQFEGYKSESYLCPAGVWTIGWGTTVVNGKRVKPGMRCTEDEANEWLITDIQSYLAEAERLIKVELTQGQVDAVASFLYNLGVTNFSKSTLLRMINSNKLKEAAEQFLRWNKTGGKVLAGLTRRRAGEKEMFLGDIV